MKNDRNYQIDAFTGIMIICSCMNHIDHTNILLGVFYFFMPWFFFKAGYFCKSEDLKTTFSKSIHRLVIPFVCFSILGLLARCIQYRNDLHYNIITSQFSSLFYNGAPWCLMPLWFLTALFFCRLFFSLIHNQFLQNIAVLLGLIIAMADAYGVMPKYMPLVNFCLGIFFWQMGHLFRVYGKKINLSFCFFVFILTYLFFSQRFDMRTNVAIEGDYLLTILGSILGCVVCMGLSNVTTCRFPILEYIGRNSMTIYCSHFIVLILLRSFVELEGQTKNVAEIVSLLLTMPLLVAIFKTKYLKWMIGE